MATQSIKVRPLTLSFDGSYSIGLSDNDLAAMPTVDEWSSVVFNGTVTKGAIVGFGNAYADSTTYVMDEASGGMTFIYNLLNWFGNPKALLYIYDTDIDGGRYDSQMIKAINSALGVSVNELHSSQVETLVAGNENYLKDFDAVIFDSYYKAGSSSDTGYVVSNSLIESLQATFEVGLPILGMINNQYLGIDNINRLFGKYGVEALAGSAVVQVEGATDNHVDTYGDFPSWIGVSDLLVRDTINGYNRYSLGCAQIRLTQSDPVSILDPTYDGDWYEVYEYETGDDDILDGGGAIVREDCCYYIDEIFTSEGTASIDVIAPENWEYLAEQGALEIVWTGDHETNPELELIEYNSYKTQAKFRVNHQITQADIDAGIEEISYSLTVTGTDTRFSKLDVGNALTFPLTFQLPECIIVGNEPDFSVSDVTVVEGDSGTVNAVFTITASEEITGQQITVDYATIDHTAQSFGEEAEVQTALLDDNGDPFITYLEFQDVRVVFDGSFPRYYNDTFFTVPNFQELFNNVVAFLNTKGGTRMLLLGDMEREGGNYDIKGAGTKGFASTIPVAGAALGYTVDSYYYDELRGGWPDKSFFDAYDVVVYVSSYFGQTASLNDIFVNALEQSVREGTGLYLVADHTESSGSFAINANKIANRFYAEFYGNTSRDSMSNNIDSYRSTHGDNPIIAGMTGDLPGQTTEGSVRTNTGVSDPADYESRSGSLTFAPGDTTKTVSVPVNGDLLDEGDEQFYFDLSNLSRGTLVKARGVGTITDDDSSPAIPIGGSAGAGGDGVIFATMGFGETTGVFVLGWNAYSKHDRWDVYRDGEWVNSSCYDLEENRGSIEIPNYDKAAWEAAGGTYDGTEDGSNAIIEVRQEISNRGGSGLVFVPHYDEFGYNKNYEVRAEGPDGTGWQMRSTKLDLRDGPGAGSTANYTTSELPRNGYTAVHDLSANLSSGNRTITITANKQSGLSSDHWDPGDGFDPTNNETDDTLNYKIEVYRVGTKIGESAWTDPASAASVVMDFDPQLDFPYIEVRFIVDLSALPVDYTDRYSGSISAKSYPIYAWWDYSIGSS